MNLSSQGNPPKAPGSIRNNPAFQKFQNADNPTSAPGTKPIPPKPEQRGRQSTTQTGEAKVLYPSASNTTPGNAAPTETKTRSVKRSRSGSGSPTKKLIQRERSTGLPRVSQVQNNIANELGSSPAITQATNEVMPQVSGPAMGLRLNLAELQRATLIETTQPPATARARAAEREETDKSQKARSASPKKKVPASSSPHKQPDSASNKKKSGLLNLFKSPSRHRKGSKTEETEKTPKSKRGTEVQVRSPRSPEPIPQPLSQKSSPVLTQPPLKPPAPGSLVSPKPLPKPPEPKQHALQAEPMPVQQAEALSVQPQAEPVQAMPEQPSQVDTQAELPTSPTIFALEDTATPLQTPALPTEEETPASATAKPKTPKTPGSPLAPRMAPKPLLKPKTPATPSAVSTTQTGANKDTDSKDPDNKSNV